MICGGFQKGHSGRSVGKGFWGGNERGQEGAQVGFCTMAVVLVRIRREQKWTQLPHRNGLDLG